MENMVAWFFMLPYTPTQYEQFRKECTCMFRSCGQLVSEGIMLEQEYQELIDMAHLVRCTIEDNLTTKY